MKERVKINLLFDTHIHFFEKEFQKNLSQNFFEKFFLEREKYQVGYFCNVGIDLVTSQKAVAFAKKFDFLVAAVGVHPSMSKDWNSKSLEVLKKFLKEPKVVAIGEIGLDFYRKFSPKLKQIEVFSQQLNLAQTYQKPVLLHIRDAYDEVLKILKNYQVKGVVHCFSGNWKDAQAFLQLGFYLSFSGVLTFKNAKILQDIALKTPLEKIVLETDAPYLTPHPHRGKLNLPQYLLYTAKKLASIKGVSLTEVIQQTTKNACKIFGC